MRDRRGDDDGRAFCFGVGHVARQVPAEAVHLFLAAVGPGVLDRIRTDARRRRAVLRGRVANAPAVIVAELDQHDVAALELSDDPVPAPFGKERTAAAPADGGIDHIDPARIEPRRDALTPADRAVLAAALDGGVAHQEQGRQRRVARRLIAHGARVDDGPHIVHGLEEPRHARIAQGFQFGRHHLRIERSAGPVGVNALLGHGGGEHRHHALAAHCVVAARHQFVQVDEAHLLAARHFARPAGIVGPVAAHGALLRPFVDPGLARDERGNDRRCALRARVGDELAQVPAVAVHRFALARQEVVDLLHVVAHAADRAACALVVVDGRRVVVPELHDHDVARLDQGQRARPVPAADVGAARQPAHRAVDQVDLRRIDVGRQWIAPPPLPLRALALAVVVAIAHGGVANQDDRWQRRIGRLGQHDLGARRVRIDGYRRRRRLRLHARRGAGQHEPGEHEGQQAIRGAQGCHRQGLHGLVVGGFYAALPAAAVKPQKESTN